MSLLAQLKEKRDSKTSDAFRVAVRHVCEQLVEHGCHDTGNPAIRDYFKKEGFLIKEFAYGFCWRIMFPED